MANQKGETTSIGHFYNRCVDAVNNLFDTMSFWTHSKDVEFVDGKTAETKVGAINGITSDISGEADDIAASIKCVNELNSSLQWKTIYNGAIGSVNVNVENKEELRLRLLLSDKQYSPYMTISTEQTVGIWVLFCHVGNNIASVQFSIKDNVLSYVSHNFVGSWTINTFTLEVLAK